MILELPELERTVAAYSDPRIPPPSDVVSKKLQLFAVHAFHNASTFLASPPIRDKRAFQQAHQASWNEFLVNLNRWPSVDTPVSGVNDVTGALFVTWSYPEMPLLFRWVVSKKVLLLVSNVPRWLKPLQDADCLLLMTQPGAVAQLAQEMARRRPVGWLCDNGGPSFSPVSVPLFGRPVNTPTAVFARALASGYRMAFLNPKDGAIVLTAERETAGPGTRGPGRVV